MNNSDCFFLIYNLAFYFEYEPQIFWKCGSERRYDCVYLLYIPTNIYYLNISVEKEIFKDKNFKNKIHINLGRTIE